MPMDNGGLFTFEPHYVDAKSTYTPDYRRWGGGTHTAQNQRLVYWPMLKSGDYDALKSQLDFYVRILKNAELRSQVYWNHEGAAFTEQIENFGLPEHDEYGLKRPVDFDPGMEYGVRVLSDGSRSRKLWRYGYFCLYPMD